MKLKGKTALVTGAGPNIGQEICSVLAGEGASVACNDVHPVRAKASAERIEKAGGTALAVPGDITDPVQVQAMVNRVTERFRGIDILVNNAAITGKNVPMLEIDEAEWDHIITVDLKSVYLCCRAVLPHMIERGYGKIVNVASVAGKEGNPGLVPYSTAKAGVIGLTKALAKEVVTKGVYVNAVAPAVIETPILKTLTEQQISYMTSRIPMGRVGKPEEVAAVIHFLASDDASFVTGQCYDVSGGRATY